MKPRLRTTSQSGLRPPAPLVGEPLAKRLSFAKCQGLSLWESWREAPERARLLQVKHRHSDSIALTKSLPIAAQRLFRAGLALSVTFGATARVAAPSVCFAVACILLAAAPTAPPCFRRWRRSSPLLPEGEALASRATSYWTPRRNMAQKGGPCYRGQPLLDDAPCQAAAGLDSRALQSTKQISFARPEET